MIIIIRFKKLTLQDKDIIESYLKKCNLSSYEYTFPSLYLWRNLSNVKYAIVDGILIIHKWEEGKGSFFMQPIGYDKDKLNDLVDELKSIKRLCKPTYLFGDIEQNFIEDLKYKTNLPLKIQEDVNDFEYIYKTQDLIELSGKKFHGKKNHYNSFVKNYNYEITDISTDKVRNDCLKLLEKWRTTKVIVGKELIIEEDAVADILDKLDILNLKSIAVYVDGNLAGFSIGERYNNNMANILVEKADINYKGIYAFINREFLKKDFADTEYVNRQEDTGDPGLRKAKESYNPVGMVEKYLGAIC